MKSLVKGCSLIITLIPVLAMAAGGSASRGTWSCNFIGQEWREMPPGSGHQQLVVTSYSSRWRPSREIAYSEAESDCEYWSDTNCEFNRCRQKRKK